MASTALISHSHPFAHSITVRNPFHPHQDRQITAIPGPVPLRALVPEMDQSVLVLRNGEAQLRATWDQPVRCGDLVAIIVLPQGGGGGGGSNPLRMVLMLAVMVYAPVLASELIGINGAAVLGSMGVTAVQAGATMLGMALVNAVIPPPKPTTAQQAASLAAPSPTYNLQAQGNIARLDQAIPVQYGRVCAYPDFAAQPYPVEEITIAGNLRDMFRNIAAIGNDVLVRGSKQVGSILIEEMKVAGH